MMMLTLVLVFATLLCLGLPIAFVLGISALVMIAFYSSSPLSMVPEIMYNSLDTFPLMAIPFFVLAAQFMVRGGVTKYLIEATNCYIGHVRGGLAIVAVVACMIFAAICGSSVATALAIGVIVIPAMMKYGYPRSFAAGVGGGLRDYGDHDSSQRCPDYIRHYCRGEHPPAFPGRIHARSYGRSVLYRLDHLLFPEKGIRRRLPPSHSGSNGYGYLEGDPGFFPARHHPRRYLFRVCNGHGSGGSGCGSFPHYQSFYLPGSKP